MKFVLSCRHTGNAIKPLEELALHMVCPVCGTLRKLLAVESREYHVKCDSCRFGRWCGQDERRAKMLAANHIQGHDMHIDYQVTPRNRRLIDDMFGRKVKRIIDEDRLVFDPKLLDEVLPQATQLPDDGKVPF